MIEGLVFIFCCIAAAIAYNMHKLTAAGAVAGSLLAIALYLGAGGPAILFMGVFFILAVLATSWNSSRKIKSGLARPGDGTRDIYQVMANGGAAFIVALLAMLWPKQEMYLLLIAAAFSSAAADTISSELGSLYGSRFVNILNWKHGARGQNGVVSIEGLLFGIAASIIVACCYLATVPAGLFHFTVIVLAGTIGNLTDSLLGAAFENKGMLNNNQVNFTNTAVAVLSAWLMTR